VNFRLVMAGTHQEFLGWLASGGRSVAEYRPVRGDNDLAGIRVREVASFDQVGTYWTNPVWGSERYKQFMAEGVAYDMHWASPWEADFTRCQAIQTAWRGVGTWADTVAGAAQRQRDLEDLLGG
jgi:hypothetical protein